MPTTPEATTMEAAAMEATAEPTGVGETYMVEAATHAMPEAATSEVGEPWVVVDVADTASHGMVETVTAEAG